MGCEVTKARAARDDATGVPIPGRSLPAGLRGFALIALQLALVLLVVRRFDVAAQNHFFPVLCVAVGGFLVHAWLPPRFRAAFFCLLSFGGLFFVLGWPNGAWVVGLGGGLIALCRLPLRPALRVALVLLAGLLLAMGRVEYDSPCWPVLGSMFMFRLIVYLYELRHESGRPPLDLTLAYFFPLPNVSFLFFPVLDFRTFRDTYRPDASWEAAQSGVAWLVRGLSHLLLYRVIKYYVLPAPHEVVDGPHLALFLAANYALYLHVSGHFHLITGVFHLFGFALPRTHHHYFLASSFTDIWRRINIYWKDFMMKVVFLPTFFALRGLGTRAAASAAVLVVFLSSWLLHAYQVFWITGALPLTLYDAVLWLTVGLLVAVNLQLDLARASRSTPARRGTTLWAATTLAWRVVVMFVLVSIFWACWNTPGFFKHVRALPLGGPRVWSGVAQVLAVLAAVVAVGVAWQLARDALTRRGLTPPRPSSAVSALGLTAALAVLLLAGTPEVAAVFGPRAAATVAALRRESVTPVEAAQVVQGYYEEITDVRVPTGSWLAALEGREKPPDHVSYTAMTRPSDDLLERELIPGWVGDVDGQRLTVNRLGMRDRPDRTREKPPLTCRVALVGSSVVMGFGVADDEPFPLLLEDRLNTRRPEGGLRYEVLNFGTGRSYAIQRRVLIDRKVFAFDPDAIYYVAHQDELLGTSRHLAKLVGKCVPLPYPCLDDVVRRAGVTPDTSWGSAEVQLQPFARELVLGVYRDLVAACRRRDVLPVWVYLPMPGVTELPDQYATLAGPAREAGFEVVNLAGWEEGYRPADVKLGESDHHPNALGHRLLADRLDRVFRQRPELLPVKRRATTATP